MASGPGLSFTVVCEFQVHTPGSEAWVLSAGEKTGSGMRPLNFGVKPWARKETPSWVRWHTFVIPGPGNPRLKTEVPGQLGLHGGTLSQQKRKRKFKVQVSCATISAYSPRPLGDQSHQTELVMGAVAYGLSSEPWAFRILSIPI